ncbi:hypothetical protein RRSWK_00306 [Rhodopirellula sp. SWK7]|nr:hypothetical protein RRSWK_00306 [Rhodopirellula sp. SWK7]
MINLIANTRSRELTVTIMRIVPSSDIRQCTTELPILGGNGNRTMSAKASTRPATNVA